MCPHLDILPWLIIAIRAEVQLCSGKENLSLVDHRDTNQGAYLAYFHLDIFALPDHHDTSQSANMFRRGKFALGWSL